MKKISTKDMTLAAVVAAVYILLTTLNPISYGMIQMRISEIICIFPFINKKFIPGCFLGVAIANCFSSLGFIDVAIGLIIAAIAYFLIIKIKSPYICAILYSITSGVFVAMELFYIAGTPYGLSFISVAGSQVIITLIGVPIAKKIIEILQKNKML